MAEDKKSAKKWIEKISTYEKTFQPWEQEVSRILKVYKNKPYLIEGASGFPILWSNVQTIVPAVFAKLPKPDVSRRFKDNDPVGRVAALLLERALEFEIENYTDYRSGMKNSVYDRFLGGRGVAWAYYDPHFSITVPNPDGSEESLQITDDAEIDEDAENEPEEELDYECARVDYVHWKDFGHTMARTWEEVTAVWRRVYMPREALIKRFGEEIGAKIPLDTIPIDEEEKNFIEKNEYEAAIYEIWDKDSKKAIWVSKGMSEILDEKDDPLDLESFFPCPKPLYATLTTDDLIPTPDYCLYEDQAKTLNVLSHRIDGLVKALKVSGVYNSEVGELQRLFTEASNTGLIPVSNWFAFSEKSGLKGAIDIVDLQPIYQALLGSYQAMEQLKSQIYDITGLSDIIRGQTNAAETATAQQIKGQYASLRLKAMQEDVARFAADLMQLKAQIICKFFQPETLLKIASADQLQDVDKQYIPAAIELLKNDDLSSFRIEVSVDSLVQIDENAEKEARMELLTASGSFIKNAIPAIQASPMIAPLLIKMLEFGVTGFKVGKTLEGVFDEIGDKLIQQSQQPQQPKPDPEMMKLQQQSQIEQQRMAADRQSEQDRMQADLMIRKQELTMEGQFRAAEAQQKMQLEMHQAEQTRQLEMMKSHMEAQLALILAKLTEQTKIEVAEIGAQATLSAQQNAAAQAAVQE